MPIIVPINVTTNATDYRRRPIIPTLVSLFPRTHRDFVHFPKFMQKSIPWKSEIAQWENEKKMYSWFWTLYCFTKLDSGINLTDIKKKTSSSLERDCRRFTDTGPQAVVRHPIWFRRYKCVRVGALLSQRWAELVAGRSCRNEKYAVVN